MILREMGTIIILGFVLLSISLGVLMRLDMIDRDDERETEKEEVQPKKITPKPLIADEK